MSGDPRSQVGKSKGMRIEQVKRVNEDEDHDDDEGGSNLKDLKREREQFK